MSDVKMITRSEAIAVVEREMERKLEEVEVLRTWMRGRKFGAEVERAMEEELDRIGGNFVRSMRNLITSLRHH